MVTTPSELDFGHETVGPLLEKYFRGSQDCSTEDRVRAVRLIEFLTTGPGGASYRTESLHGAGSPQTQRVMIWRGAGLEHKKNLAKSLAGIDTEALGPECVTEP